MATDTVDQTQTKQDRAVAAESGCDPADLVGDLTGARSVPPYVCTGVRLYSFPVVASPAKLNALCDKYLNTPAGGAAHWIPLAGLLYIQILRYDRVVSAPYSQLGYISQNELAIQIPIFSTGGATGPSVGFFSAFLVVDHPLSLTGGREVFGFPKNLGTFNFVPESVSVTTWLTPSSTPNTPVGEHPLLSVPNLAGISYSEALAQATGSVPDEDPVRRAKQDAYDIRRLWPMGPTSELWPGEDGRTSPVQCDQRARPLLFSEGVPMLYPTYAVEQLKEIDSTTVLSPSPQKAAYQARVSSQATLNAFRGAGFLASEHLLIDRYDPLDLVEIFGIVTDPSGRVRVHWPYWVDLDFTVEEPTLLTKFC